MCEKQKEKEQDKEEDKETDNRRWKSFAVEKKAVFDGRILSLNNLRFCNFVVEFII